MPLLTQADPLIPLPAVQRGIFNQPGNIATSEAEGYRGLAQHGGPAWLAGGK